MSGPHPAAPHRLPPPCPVCADLPGSPHGTPAPPAATPGQAAYEEWAAGHQIDGDDEWLAWSDLDAEQADLWRGIAEAAITAAPGDLVTLTGALADLAIARRERDDARKQLAATQAIARMLQATAIEILDEFDRVLTHADATNLIDRSELARWRERLGGDHA